MRFFLHYFCKKKAGKSIISHFRGRRNFYCFCYFLFGNINGFLFKRFFYKINNHFFHEKLKKRVLIKVCDLIQNIYNWSFFMGFMAEIKKDNLEKALNSKKKETPQS